MFYMRVGRTHTDVQVCALINTSDSLTLPCVVAAEPCYVRCAIAVYFTHLIAQMYEYIIIYLKCFLSWFIFKANFNKSDH